MITKLLQKLLRRSSVTVRNSTIAVGVKIEKGAQVIGATLGHNSYIGPESRLFGVDVGAYASVGPRVIIGENEHEKKLFSTSDMLFDCINRCTYEVRNSLRTDIGADVWIGANAFVRKGTRIGVGAIVGAHTVVLKDVPPYAIVGGVPARLLAYRFSSETCRRLEKSRWWTLDKTQLQSAIISFYGPTETASMQSEEGILAFVEVLDSLVRTLNVSSNSRD